MRFEFLTPTLSDAQILDQFCPPVRTWWQSRFPTLSHPQRLAVPAIHAGRNTLVCAPTGSGKTLCAFIALLSDLFTRSAAGTLEPTIDTLYISPMRALAADITKNLLAPLDEISNSLAVTSPPIENQKSKIENVVTVALRTGDTTPTQRSRLARHPPHILITTPETLALCLVNPTMRGHLRSVRRIIIDELHSLIPNKRGVDLLVSLERLADLITSSGNPDPQRIGLSATIAPLERMAACLVGSDSTGRTCAIADASFDRPLDLQIASVFGKTPFATTATINRHVYDLLEKTIRAHRTTLIFTNLRAATERVTFHLRKKFAAGLHHAEYDEIIAPEQIVAHHSSLDREVRLEVERRLKAGELRCVVCSTSLELGIDIGSIDRVILLNNPRGVARGLQRVGRSGHSLDGIASGLFIPTLPADLLEAAVTADAMRKRQIDPIDIPRNCLDILAQQLLAMAIQAQPIGIHIDHAYEIFRRTLPYADLPREQFDAMLNYVAISESASSPEGPSAPPTHAKLLLDPAGFLHPLKKSLAALYSQNVGTIAQEGQVKVRLSSESNSEKAPVIGAIEEAFAQLLKPNDRFLLGGRCVRVIGGGGSKGMSVHVAESIGETPTIPRWYSGSMGMEPGLAAAMRTFRANVRTIAPAGPAAIARMLTRQFSLPDDAAHIAAAYLHAQHRYAEIPTESTGLLVERVPEDEATVLVFHTMIGRQANEALARILAYRMHQRFGGNTTVVVDDYAFGIWIRQSTAARRADRTLIRSLLTPDQFTEHLTTAIEASDLFRAQFRYTALRAHTLLRNKFGRRRFIGQMQSYATKLYESLRHPPPTPTPTPTISPTDPTDPDGTIENRKSKIKNDPHPLIQETHRTILHDLLNTPLAEKFLKNLPNQPLHLLDLPTPSPFAFGLFASGSAKRDTLQLADTADFLLEMYQRVQARLANQQQFTPEPAQTELFQ